MAEKELFLRTEIVSVEKLFVVLSLKLIQSICSLKGILQHLQKNLLFGIRTDTGFPSYLECLTLRKTPFS